MRLFNLLITSIIIVSCFSNLNAQTIKINPWHMHAGQGPIDFVCSEHGDPAAYAKMNIPNQNDGGWALAPVDAAGNVNFTATSTIPCLKQVDFTYFQTIVEIPRNTNVTEFSVSYLKTDDGARIYVFNSDHPNGAFDEKADLKLGKTKPDGVDLKHLIKVGEENRVVIVQFDDCASGNNVHGINISVNGDIVKPVEAKQHCDFKWSSVPSVSGNTATGEIDGIKYTYTSSVAIETTNDVWAHSTFPAEDKIPNHKCIKNSQKSSNVLQFERAVKDPVLVFASIGQKGMIVPIEFKQNIEILFQKNLVATGSKSLSGEEGYAIVRVLGMHDKIEFEYTAAENFVNFVFGAAVCQDQTDHFLPINSSDVYLEIDQAYYSKDKKYFLVWQSDGNLCVYSGTSESKRFVWGSYNNKQAPLGGKKCIMQSDGNLCLYTGSNGFLWCSMATGSGNTLDINSKGELIVVNSSGTEIWNGSK